MPRFDSMEDALDFAFSVDTPIVAVVEGLRYAIYPSGQYIYLGRVW